VLSNKLVLYDLEQQMIGWTEYNCEYYVVTYSNFCVLILSEFLSNSFVLYYFPAQMFHPIFFFIYLFYFMLNPRNVTDCLSRIYLLGKYFRQNK